MKYSTDVWFCAFLSIKGIKPVGYEIIGKGRVKCQFSLSEQEWQKYKLEFNNSEISRYKAEIEAIKDLCY